MTDRTPLTELAPQEVRDISQGQRIRFLDANGELVGTVNGEVLLHDGDLYIPVYVSEDDRCMVIHASNVVEVLR